MFENKFERIQYKHNEFILNIQNEYGGPLKKLKVLSNDPFYMTLGNVKKAVTMTDIWIKEGWKEKYEEWVQMGKPNDKIIKQKLLVHPRGMHYQIDKRYYIEKDSEPLLYDIQNDFCWIYCQKGIKFAKQMNLIPNDAIKDKKNPEAWNVPYYREHEDFEIPEEFKCSSDYLKYDFRYNNIDRAIERIPIKITEKLTEMMVYYEKTAQPNHLELWCEKSEIIPFNIAKKFNLVIRECGGGEASDFMCYDAVIMAKKANKDLHIFYLADFDSAGENMPISAGRKIEYYAKKLGNNAFVHTVSLTYKQIIQYGLPSRPPEKKELKKLKFGKAYRTRYDDFIKRWGIKPTEINAFQALRTKEFEQEIENAISPYYDNEMGEKIEKAENKLKNDIAEKIKEELETKSENMKEKRETIEEKLEKLDRLKNMKEKCSSKFNSLYYELSNKYSNLRHAINELRGQKEERIKLDESVNEYNDLFDISVKDVLKDIKFKMPEANIEIGEDALLNTNRTFIKQLEIYNQYRKLGKHEV